MARLLSAEDFERETDLPDWRFLLGRIEATFRAGSFPAAADLVGHIAAAAEEADHHPDLDVRYPDRVRVALTTHAAGGLTELDTGLAAVISGLAGAAGIAAEPHAAARTEIAIDALDIDAVRPFWTAILGYREVAPVGGGTITEIVDPDRIGPTVWFQQMDEQREQRNRIHIDVTVAHDIAERRLGEAIVAGGVLLSDRRAPAFWVLADPEGNEACVCTWLGREQR